MLCRKFSHLCLEQTALQCTQQSTALSTATLSNLQNIEQVETRKKHIKKTSKKIVKKRQKRKNDKFLTGNNQNYPEWKMALEVYRIILLIGVFSVGCNGIIRAPVLDKVQKIAADDSSEISENVKDHNLNRTHTCPQHCRCVWFENDSSFQSISCFLANVTQGKIIFCDFLNILKICL